MGEDMALADGNFVGMGHSFEKLLAVMETEQYGSVTRRECAPFWSTLLLVAEMLCH